MLYSHYMPVYICFKNYMSDYNRDLYDSCDYYHWLGNLPYFRWNNRESDAKNRDICDSLRLV